MSLENTADSSRLGMVLVSTLIAVLTCFLGCQNKNVADTPTTQTESQDQAQMEAVKRTVTNYIHSVVNGDKSQILSLLKVKDDYEKFVTSTEFNNVLAGSKELYSEARGGIKDLKLSVVEIDEHRAVVLASIRFEDEYLIALGEKYEGFLANMLLPELYGLTREKDKWLVTDMGGHNEDTVVRRAESFLEELFDADGVHNSFIEPNRSSIASRQNLSELKLRANDLIRTIHRKSFPSAEKLNDLNYLKFGSDIVNVLPKGDRVDVELKVSLFGDRTTSTLMSVSMFKDNDKWRVSLDETIGLIEINSRLQKHIVKLKSNSSQQRIAGSAKQNEPEQAKPHSPLRRPRNQAELKSFAKSIANATARSIVDSIGGGQDLVVNVIRVDFDQSLDEFEIDINISFNGEVLRGDNYQVAGRVTVSGNGSDARFARTLANEKYKEWEWKISAIKITTAILEAAKENQK